MAVCDAGQGAVLLSPPRSFVVLKPMVQALMAADPVALLRRYPLFALPPAALLEEWIRLGQHVGYSLGETLFQEGSPGAWMYLILHGKVRVLRRAEGKEVTQSVLHTGQLFGDYAI